MKSGKSGDHSVLITLLTLSLHLSHHHSSNPCSQRTPSYSSLSNFSLFIISLLLHQSMPYMSPIYMSLPFFFSFNNHTNTSNFPFYVPLLLTSTFAMENMRLRKHNTNACIANSHTPSLALHKDSHMVSKTKPKIRIIHIFAPEIIKTDVENFRELVQKLTGKPSGEKCCKKNKAREKREKEYSRSSSSTSASGMLGYHNTVITMKNNNGGCWGLDVTKEKVKEEVGVCSSDESSGGYLGGFTDLEGFISEIGGFPFLPLDGNHMMQGFEEPQLL